MRGKGGVTYPSEKKSKSKTRNDKSPKLDFATEEPEMADQGMPGFDKKPTPSSKYITSSYSSVQKTVELKYAMPTSHKFAADLPQLSGRKIEMANDNLDERELTAIR